MTASSLERAGELLASVLRALDEVSGDVESARVLLALLGWDLPPGVRDIGLAQLDVSAVAARLDELVELRSQEEPSDVDVAAAVGEVLVALGTALDDLAGIAASFQAPQSYLQATDIVDEFFPRLADVLVIQLVGSVSPVAVPVGILLGVFELTPLPADPATFQVAHVRQVVRWDRLSMLATDPGRAPREVYGWGTTAFDGNRLVGNIARVLEHVSDRVAVRAMPRGAEEVVAGRPVPEADTDPRVQLFASIVKDLGVGGLDVGLTLYPVRETAPNATDAGLGLSPFVVGTADVEFPLSDTLSLGVSASPDVQGGLALVLRPGADPEVVTGLLGVPARGSTTASFSLQLRSTARAGGRHVLLSVPGLAIDAAAVTAGLGVDPIVVGRLEDGRIQVVPDRSDGFLASIVPPEGVNAALDLEVSWSHDKGLRVNGGVGLRASFALHTRLGPFGVDTLDLAVTGDPDGIAARATVGGAVVLGPFVATLDAVGVSVGLRFERGNLGPVDGDATFVPPTGIGLAVDAGIVTGGGFIARDPATGRYSGAVEVTIGDVAVTGVGVLDTRLPGDASGYALLVALRATFPGIELGYGFRLTGVGGLLALNRRVDVDALRSRLASGTAGRILAPEDPVRHAPALLADLDAVFPPAPGVTVVGPTAQLTWAGLVRFDIGLFVELPGPARVVLLGSARAAIERDGRAYLVIRVDIVGEVDLQRGTAAFDAVLVDSQLLEVLDLTGGAAFRLSVGDQPYAVLTVGGFHPAYNPEPLVFPSSLARVAMVHGHPDDRLYLRFEGYFAVTTNTLQLGAAVEAVINAGNFNIQGIVQFDALIQFEPFRFAVDIRASVRVRYKSRTLAGLTLTGSLAGPGPVVLRAKVCIELLFFDICFSDTFTLGSSTPPQATPIASALAALAAELDEPSTLHASGTDRFVVLQPAPPGPPVLSPVGQLVWVQRRAPLDVLLQRIGGTPLGSPQRVTATSPDAAGAEVEWFAPGSFADLTDDQALNRKPFERLAGGLRLGAPGTVDGPAKARALTIRQIRLPAATSSVRGVAAFPGWLVGRLGAAATPAATVADERWTVTDVLTGDVVAGLSAAEAHQRADLGGRARVAVPAADVLAEVVF